MSFHGTDIAADGVKMLLLGGVPRLEGNDTDRLMRTALEIVRAAKAAAPDVPAVGPKNAVC